MSNTESCDEKIKTEKDEERRGQFRMQKRTGLVCDKVTRKLKLPHSPFSASRPTFRTPRPTFPSRSVARFAWFSKVASMIRECRLDGVWRVIVVLAVTVAGVAGSEFPERECCDPVYPQNTATTATAPVTPPLQPSVKLTGEFRFRNF